MPSQQQISNTPESQRDSWQTPDWLFAWADHLFGFDIDLAASFGNAKTDLFLTAKDDSLSLDWHKSSKKMGFCNPPYSDVGTWLRKGWDEAQKGFNSVFLVPTPNGENYWQDAVFGKASEIIFITGRVAFELPNERGKPTPKTGNTRGSCLVVFNRKYEGPTSMGWVGRDETKQAYQEVNTSEKGQ